MKNILELDGGPFDGAVLSWESDNEPHELPITGVTIKKPAKMEGDTEAVWSGEMHYEYVTTYSTGQDGIELIAHTAVYFTASRKQLKANTA